MNYSELRPIHQLLFHPWPWYVAGPILGLFAPLLLLLGNKLFGVSGSLRDVCAAVYPRNLAHFRYDWKGTGGWNLAFGAGILIGGFIAGVLLKNPEPVAISESTKATLAALGITDFTGLAPKQLFAWASLTSARGWILLAGGGFLVGFGTAYAGGCTSGHGISGVANLEKSSMVALVAFFIGGIAGTFLLLPLVLGLR